MSSRPDLGKVITVLDEALDVMLASSCNEPEVEVRRECQQVILTISHAKDRVEVLQDMFLTHPESPGV